MFSISKRFIFFHAGKCGGTAIKHYLEDQIDDCVRCGHKNVKDMESMIFDYGIDGSDFLKFTSVRNPWERMVSNYLHTEKHHNLTDRHLIMKINHFRVNLKFILEYHSMTDKLYNNLFPKYEEYDLVIKTEDMQNGINELSKLLKIEQREIQTRNVSSHNFPYNLFYDKDSIELIEKYFYKCIERFNYSFS